MWLKKRHWKALRDKPGSLMAANVRRLVASSLDELRGTGFVRRSYKRRRLLRRCVTDPEFEVVRLPKPFDPVEAVCFFLGTRASRRVRWKKDADECDEAMVVHKSAAPLLEAVRGLAQAPAGVSFSEFRSMICFIRRTSKLFDRL
jgi:hypothetical protein